VRGPGHVERRAPGDVAVLRELKVPPLAVQSHGDQPDARPRVQPAVQEPQLGRAGRELEEGEGGAEGDEAAVHLLDHQIRARQQRNHLIRTSHVRKHA
jgi:hypothetical protein